MPDIRIFEIIILPQPVPTDQSPILILSPIAYAVGSLSDCISRGCDLDPGPVLYFLGD